MLRTDESSYGEEEDLIVISSVRFLCLVWFHYCVCGMLGEFALFSIR